MAAEKCGFYSSKGIVLAILAVLFAVSSAPSSAGERGPVQSWTGYVTDTWCGVNRDTKAPDAQCTNDCVHNKGAKYAFYNLADGRVYVLNPQKKAAPYAGMRVVLKGVVDHTSVAMKTMRGDRKGETITAVEISPEKL
jgi:hypothetical protein